MIFLTFLFIVSLWLIVATMLSKRIPYWLGADKHKTALSVALFPVLLAAPVADDLIGRWQFYRLCDREAVVTLSPDWEKTRRARVIEDPIVEIAGYAIPIRVQRVEIQDLDTGSLFFQSKAFHTKGGVLFGRLGLGLGLTKSCRPKDETEVLNKLNIDRLVEQGKIK